MARAPCESVMAPSVAKPERHESRFHRSWKLAGMDVYFVCVGMLTYYH